MFRKKRTWLLLALVPVLLAAVVFLDPTCVILGWLRGESFYQGRPTSWWRREISEWEIRINLIHDQWTFERFTTHFSVSELIFKGQPWVRQKTAANPPSLLKCDPAARSVLREFMNDSSPIIREIGGQSLTRLDKMGEKGP